MPLRITAALAAELIVVTDILDEPGLDVTDSLHRLAAVARAAIGSFLGLTITIVNDGQEVHFTAMEEPGPSTVIVTSLNVPLRSERHGPDTLRERSEHQPATLTLYAGQAGALIDLAADISWLTGGELQDALFDQHLVPPDSGGPRGLGASTTINQAIGVLIARGQLPDQARRQLDRWGEAAGGDRLSAARRLLGSLDD